MEKIASIKKHERWADFPKRHAMAIFLSCGLFCVELLKNHLITAYFTFLTGQKNLDGYHLKVEEPFSVYVVSYVLAKIMSALLAGVFIHKFSANIVIGTAVSSLSLLHMFLPLSVNVGKTFYILISITLGMLEGPIYPAFYAFWRYWAPPKENTLLVAIGLSGVFIGRFLLPMPSLFDFSWATGFYSYGGLGLCWCIWWFWWSSARPMYPIVSWKELLYIEQHTRVHSTKENVIPLKSIFTSLPVYALLIASFANGWNYEIIDITISGTLAVNVTHTGLSSYAALKYLMVGSMLITGLVSDVLRRSRRMSTTTVRTLFIGGGLISIALMLLTFVPSFFSSNLASEVLQIMGYCGYYLLQGFTLAGLSTNALDLDPTCACFLIGLSFGIENAAETARKLIQDNLANSNHEATGDQIYLTIMIVGIIINIISGAFYAKFASGDYQHWTEVKSNQNEASIQNDAINL